MAATIYTLEAEKHCYEIPFTGSRMTKMCNIGQRLSIGVPSNFSFDRLEALLVMDIEFNGKTTEGSSKCNKDLEDSVLRGAKIMGVPQMIANSIGVPLTRFMESEVKCAPKDCFKLFDFRTACE